MDFSTDSPPSPTSDQAYQSVVEIFRRARNANTRRDFLNREFVLVQAVSDAVLGPEFHQLLDATYARINRAMPRNKPTEIHNCLPIFYTLLDLERGHLVHHFTESDTHKLPIELPKLVQLFPDHNFPGFARQFYDRQWRWCPMEFDYHMGRKLPYPEQIIPVTNRRKIEPARDSIPKPDRKATLWVVEVPAELVGAHLKEKLQDKDDECSDKRADCAGDGGSPSAPESWRMVVKQFSKSRKEEFDREQDLFNTLGEKPGIVQYLGWYESHQPVLDGSHPNSQSANSTEPAPEVYYNLVLELGDQDLYSAFQKENPPVHFQEIRDFWRSLFDVADALASIQTIRMTSFTAYVWHGDIKPENILDVETGFKLADPGEAAVVKVSHEEDIDVRSLKTRVPGGTRTFAAPEKTTNSSNEAEPEVTQGIDIWSLACVFSVAATYAVLGKEGVKQYRLLRQHAIEKKGRHGDSFHDGRRVLDVIAMWHGYLKACIRKYDTYTAKVLEIVDRDMLIVPGQERITGAELSLALQNIHVEAGGPPVDVPVAINDFLTEELGPSQTSRSSLEDVPRTISQSGTEMFEEALLYASRTSEGRPTVRRQPTWNESVVTGESSYPAALHDSQSMMGKAHTHLSQRPSPPPQIIIPHSDYSQPATTRDDEPQGEPPTTMWEVERDLERYNIGKTAGFSFKNLGKKKSVYGKEMGGKPDRLENHFANRDIVYLVDNASSMANIWGHVTYLLRILVWRSLHYDDNGMDLKFTIRPDKLNLEPKKSQGVEDFLKKMKAATPRLIGDKTDMSASLSLILERHFQDYRHDYTTQMKRKLTILVLTDGLWERNGEFDVDNYLVNCIQKIPDIEWKPEPESTKGKNTLGSPVSLPSRPISIQFIRFGDHAKAIERLDRLDNQLRNRPELAGRSLPDVIDTESANGDVYKMFLGSMLEDFDNKYIQGAAVVTTPTSQLQSPFLHLQTAQSAPLSVPNSYFGSDSDSRHPSRSPSRSPSSASAMSPPDTLPQRSRSAARKSAPTLMMMGNRTQSPPRQDGTSGRVTGLYVSMPQPSPGNLPFQQSYHATTSESSTMYSAPRIYENPYESQPRNGPQLAESHEPSREQYGQHRQSSWQSTSSAGGK